MRKNSHRNFGKQLTIALALTVASFMTISDVQAQASKTQKSDAARPEGNLTSHDTPPTELILSHGTLAGDRDSFIIETREPDFLETLTADRRKRYQRLSLQNHKAYVAHVKVVDGWGEILYRGDYHAPGSDISVTVTTKTNDVVTLACVDNHFAVTTANTKRLVKSTGDDKPVGNVRKLRYRYGNVTGNGETAIQRITVNKGTTTVFTVDLSDLYKGGEELKVMIWVGEERIPQVSRRRR